MLNLTWEPRGLFFEPYALILKVSNPLFLPNLEQPSSFLGTLLRAPDAFQN